MIIKLDSENADRDLTSQVTVLTHTPATTVPMLCQGLVYLGDGTKNLDGSGGNFELTVTVGGQTVQPDPQVVTFSSAVRASVWTSVFPVPLNTEVILKVKSPNAADSDVDVTATLFDVASDSQASLHIWHVDGANGADTNVGHHPADALATINAAMTAAYPGDEVRIWPGTYDEIINAGGVPYARGTDLACNDHTGPAYTVTSASNSFIVNWLTGRLRITETGDSGNFVPGDYTVSGWVDAGEITLSADPTNGSNDTGGTFFGGDVPLNLIGTHKDQCIIQPTSGTVAVNVQSGSEVKHLTVIADATTGTVALAAVGKDKLVFEDLHLESTRNSGTNDALHLNNATNVHVKDVYALCSYDAVSLANGKNILFERCILEVDGSCDIATKSRCAYGSGDALTDEEGIVFRDTIFRATSSEDYGILAAVSPGIGWVFENCVLEARRTGAGTENVYGIFMEYEFDRASFINCTIRTSIAGAGTAYDIYCSDFSTIVLNLTNVNYDTSKVTAQSATVNDFSRDTQIDWANGGRLDLLLDAVPNNTELAAAFTEIKGATWASTDTLEGIHDDVALLTDLGSGDISVNHDSGGTDNLAYKTSGGAGIDNAMVRAYLTSDYTAGNTAESFVKGRVRTAATGRWTNSMRLDAGAYTFEFSKQGSYGPNTTTYTVS